jgi:nitroimidazol reductase NimA-like FMN-containing flavoprotein (pyridoxamine 5'-phosphate oxidase superfamily)
MIWEDEPLILPVNYTWDGGGVLFRTDPGTKLSACRDRSVAFEIDGLDPANRRGWSVIVKGRGRAVGPHQMAATFSSEPSVSSWVPSAKHYWIRIDAHEISGRRIVGPVADP